MNEPNEENEIKWYVMKELRPGFELPFAHFPHQPTGECDWACPTCASKDTQHRLADFENTGKTLQCRNCGYTVDIKEQSKQAALMDAINERGLGVAPKGRRI